MRLTALITSFTGTFLVGWVVSPALRALGLGIQRDLWIEKGPGQARQAFSHGATSLHPMFWLYSLDFKKDSVTVCSSEAQIMLKK